MLNFKDVKKTNKTITKEIDKSSTLVLKKGKQILELEERKTLKLNFKGLTEPRIYNEISSFLNIKSHLDLCFETPSDIIINAIKEKVLVKKKEKTIKS